MVTFALRVLDYLDYLYHLMHVHKFTLVKVEFRVCSTLPGLKGQSPLSHPPAISGTDNLTLQNSRAKKAHNL